MKITILNKSLNQHGDKIISFLLEGFPYDILAEFNKHRLFSISCESSRARKFAAVLQQILYDPFVPLFTKNQPGMSGEPFEDQSRAEQHYLNCREFSIVQAKFMDKLGIHKQDLNGLLKPWMKVSQIVTTTHTDNFYRLRRGADAKPIFREFADEMYALDQRTEGKVLKYGQWHFPYPELSLRENVAKCGSISYANHQKAADKLKLIALHDKLLTSRHDVPFEHCAMAFYPGNNIRNSKGEALQIFDHFKPLITLKTNSALYPQVGVGNFTGFLQYRKFIEYDIPVANHCSNV
jgi:hypothetical protein